MFCYICKACGLFGVIFGWFPPVLAHLCGMPKIIQEFGHGGAVAYEAFVVTSIRNHIGIHGTWAFALMPEIVANISHQPVHHRRNSTRPRGSEYCLALLCLRESLLSFKFWGRLGPTPIRRTTERQKPLLTLLYFQALNSS
jgi:hypothetical protein